MSRNELRVTIAIPTYNRAGMYLANALESALAQSYPNLEIIVSDNHSTDNTEQVVRSFRDPRIKYFRQTRNIGSVANTNFCIEQATGTYFLMLHDDDTIDPDFVHSCVAGLKDGQEPGLIVAGSRIIDQSGEIIASKENIATGYSLDDFMLAYFEMRIHLFLCSILFHRATLKEVGGFPLEFGMYNDVAAEFMVAARKGRVDIRPVKATWRSHAGSFGKTAAAAQWSDSAVKLVQLAVALAQSKQRELYHMGMGTSAIRSYRVALRAGSFLSRLAGFFIVWSKFGFRPPSRQQLVQLWPPLYYPLHPGRTLRGAVRKLLPSRK